TLREPFLTRRRRGERRGESDAELPAAARRRREIEGWRRTTSSTATATVSAAFSPHSNSAGEGSELVLQLDGASCFCPGMQDSSSKFQMFESLDFSYLKLNYM
ncbi:unnamed protein product, partial [Urochloa humidicola]